MMMKTCNPTYVELSEWWVQRFLEANRYYIEQGTQAFQGLLDDEQVKVLLMDYTQS